MPVVALDAMQKAMEEKLRAMRPRFVAQVSQRLDHMEALRDAFAAAPGKGPLADELCHAAHKLAGVAGMFGASDLGDLAREAETAFAALAQGGGAAEAGTALTLLDDLLGEMALIASA